MDQHEHDAFGEESQNLIDGLRHLARDIEVPSHLLADVLLRGAKQLPSGAPARPWWHRLIRTCWQRPVVWAPVLALACFVAGLVVSPAAHRAFSMPTGYDIARLPEDTPSRPAPKSLPSPHEALRQTVVAERQEEEREDQRTQSEAAWRHRPRHPQSGMRRWEHATCRYGN